MHWSEEVACALGSVCFILCGSYCIWQSLLGSFPSKLAFRGALSDWDVVGHQTNAKQPWDGWKEGADFFSVLQVELGPAKRAAELEEPGVSKTGNASTPGSRR